MPKSARRRALCDPGMTHSERVRLALARLPEVDPAIAALALWCRFRDGTKPTKTEGETVFIGPEFPLLPISEQTGVIAHHVLHVALRHSGRRHAARERYGAGFQPDRYDLACDALVNEALLQGGHALPRPAVRAADLAMLLPAKDRPANVLAAWDSDTLYAALAEAGSAGGGGDDDSVTRYARTQGFEPDLADSDPDKTEPDIWAGRIEQALSAGRSAGSGIGAVLARFADLPKAVVPWDIKLRRLLAKALAEDPSRTHRRPARAWLARDALARQTGGATPVFEPGLVRANKRPRLVIGLDTSSSITDAKLAMFAAEAMAAARRSGAETHLLGFDTDIHTRARISRAEAITALEMRRGGGTDFGAVLAEAASLDPSLVLMLTDLDGPTGQRIAAPVLWAVPEPPRVPPAFGEVLVMDDRAPD